MLRSALLISATALASVAAQDDFGMDWLQQQRAAAFAAAEAERMAPYQQEDWGQDWNRPPPYFPRPSPYFPRPQPVWAPMYFAADQGTLVSMSQATAVFQRSPTQAQLNDLNDCLRRYSINTPARIRHFLAQVGHESGGLRWMKELASGNAYEGRRDLGNTQRGDGPRFKGAGAIQLTGRANYQAFANAIGDSRVMEGVDYVSVRYPFTSAGFWWQRNGMNSRVDGGASVRQISARVNGRDPANGLADREAYYARALRVI